MLPEQQPGAGNSGGPARSSPVETAGARVRTRSVVSTLRRSFPRKDAGNNTSISSDLNVCESDGRDNNTCSDLRLSGQDADFDFGVQRRQENFESTASFPPDFSAGVARHSAPHAPPTPQTSPVAQPAESNRDLSCSR